MKAILFCLFTLLVCLSAKKKHFVSQDEQKTCIYENCVECPDSPYACTKCAESFILSKYGYCINSVCPDGTYYNAEWEYCATCGYKCTKCSPEGQCLSCDETSGLALNEVLHYCGCKSGFFMNYKGTELTCEKCSENCDECFLENQCSKCQKGLGYDFIQQKCAPCRPGTFLHPEYGFCTPCKTGCTQCTSYEDCSQCDEANNFSLKENACSCSKGFFLQAASTVEFRLLCSKCSENCLSCSDSNYCFECAEGFEVRVHNGQCVAKVSCEAGQYSSEGTCLSCLPNCVSCSDANTCTQCSEGLILQTYGGCEAPSNNCSPNCKSCTDFTTCTECSDGYFLLNQFCAICPPFCSSCSSSTSCSACSSGYFLNSQSFCEPATSTCPPNCVSCSATTCTQCSEGFILNPVGLCEVPPAKTSSKKNAIGKKRKHQK